MQVGKLGHHIMIFRRILIRGAEQTEPLSCGNKGSIPNLHGGDSTVITQNIQGAGMKEKMPACRGRQTEPSGYQHSENVTMSK
jgi:hypothetical protein